MAKIEATAWEWEWKQLSKMRTDTGWHKVILTRRGGMAACHAGAMLPTAFRSLCSSEHHRVAGGGRAALALV